MPRMRGKVVPIMMRKIQVFGLVAMAVCAFGALTSSSAFALGFAAAKWLDNGKEATAGSLTTTEAELLFENAKLGAAILCSGIFDGTVGAAGVDEVTAVLTLGGVNVLALDETGATGGIKCTAETPTAKICEAESEIWPAKLPFKTQLDLDTEEVEKYFDLVVEGEYFILCLVFGVSIDELCVAAAGSFGSVENEVGGVIATGAVSPLGECTKANGEKEKEVGLIESEFTLISLNSGDTLSVSE